MKGNRSKYGTAYHEAGHAVVALYLGSSVTEATIKGDEDWLGLVRRPGIFGYEWQGKRARNRTVRNFIVSTYAGAEAERLFTGTVLQGGAEYDDAVAFDLLRECPPRGCRYAGDEVYWTALTRLQKKARKLVHQLRKDIQLIADALIENETLTGQQIKTMLEQLADPGDGVEVL